MAELPTIPLTFPNIGNALATGAHARYLGQQSDLAAAEEQRRQDAQQYVGPAMQGNPQAMGKLAAGDPKAAVAITTALQRMDVNQRAKVKEQTDYSAQAANAILQADPAARPALYQQLYAEGQRRGYDMSSMPPQYSPALDGQLRSVRTMAVPIADWFKQNEGVPTPIGGGGANGAAVAGIESGGQPNGGYGAVGPVADAKGSRAVGRYQVMDYNVGPWTQEVLGRAMTPQEFLASPEAQDKVFEAKFGQYVTKYGSPQAASRAWFAGEGGMNNPNASDVNGTTVAGYEQRFNAGLPAGTQVAGPPMAGPAPAANGPPVQLGAPPPAAAPSATPPAQGLTAGIKLPPGARMMGIKGVPVVKDGNVLIVHPDGTQDWLPLPKPSDLSQPVISGPNGPEINRPLLEARKEISAAQGTDVGAYATKQLIDQTVKEHGVLQSNALQARTGLAQLDRLGSLLNQIQTGKFKENITDIKAIAKSFGIDLGVADDVAPAQAAIALANQFALQLRNPAQGAGMPGALSDRDVKILQSMIPSINTTPEGNKLLLETMRKMYQRSLDIADISNKWMRSGKLKDDPAGMYAEIQQYSDQHPLFGEGAVSPASPETGASPQSGATSPPPAGNVTQPPVAPKPGKYRWTPQGMVPQ